MNPAQGIPPAGAPGAILDAAGLSKTYRIGRVDLPVLRRVTLRVHAGESIAIVGASGAGKSTLLHLLGGLERPSGGNVRFEGRDLYRLSGAERARVRARRIGFVFQAYHLIAELNVLENVLLSSLSGWGAFRNGRALRRRAADLIERVGLGERKRHRPDELSGGEQQRVAIARALMNDPDLVLADEPTGNLDSASGARILDALFALAHDRQRAVVLVTHNAELALRCGRRIELRDGILYDPPA